MLTAREPLVAHPLPKAPAFTGRKRELQAIRDFWQGDTKLLALVGMGGAGKTALAQHFVSTILKEDPPDGMLVWSFYDDPDANAFLKTAFGYFTGGTASDVKGAGWFHMLKEALDGHGRYLLVLDGLERVQRAMTDATGIYGEIEDPLLRGLLVRLATSQGACKAIITTRFPLADIERVSGDRSVFVDINRLGKTSSTNLLRSHGVQGTDEQLEALSEQYGRHALTIDLLGGAIAEFLGGDASSVQPPNIPPDQEDAQAARLSSVLSLYDAHLSQPERDLISRLCVFRFGVTHKILEDIFLRSSSQEVVGSLAGHTEEEIGRWLDRLVEAHLVYKEEDGRFTVHPAVRDHFYRLFRDSKAFHGAVSQHLMTLSGRPGIGLPVDKGALDLLEELVYHAIMGGSIPEALDIYLNRLGGNEHLNATLGEYGRSYRILQAFPECPDSGAMYLCMRAFGDFKQALQWRPQNRYILLALGDLEKLRSDPNDRTARTARFLQGEDVAIPERLPDVPLSVAYLHLLRGAVQEAERVAMHDLKLSIYQDDIVRNEMALVEVERRRGLLQEAADRLEKLTVWVLNSGSEEHLCFMCLVRGRLALDQGQVKAALSAVDEGLQAARSSGFRLYEIELLVELARCKLAILDHAAAREAAEEALELANHPDIRFLWGEMSALAVLTEANVGLQDVSSAKNTFGRYHALHRKTRELRFQDTERRLAALLAKAESSADDRG